MNGRDKSSVINIGDPAGAVRDHALGRFQPHPVTEFKPLTPPILIATPRLEFRLSGSEQRAACIADRHKIATSGFWGTDSMRLSDIALLTTYQPPVAALIADPRLEFPLSTRKINHLKISNEIIYLTQKRVHASVSSCRAERPS